MRITDDRYTRDRQRFDLAFRMIHHEARTCTIRTWTGLSDDRIRKLYRSYAAQREGTVPVRHRGKSPRQAGFFTRTARARAQSAVLASLCRIHGLLPATGTAAERAQPALQRAELLCHAYEMYRAETPTPLIGFEHAVFLLAALARADELVLGQCGECGAALVTDRLSLRAPRCTVCEAPGAAAVSRLPLPERVCNTEA